MKKILTYTFYALVGVFAAIGLTFTAVFFGMRFGVFNVRGAIATRNSFFNSGTKTNIPVPVTPCDDTTVTTCAWNGTPEWTTVKGGLQKDAELISRVSRLTGVDSRMIAAVVVPEQTRFFTANREIFKSYFEPLKLLGSMTQFSLGVSGIKQETAKAIEEHAQNPASPFYPGIGADVLLAYDQSVTDHDAELYKRLTDEKDHYYQYLYTALFIKEIQHQWSAAGYSVDRDPETVVTLFNIGFGKSKPNANPQPGGAVVTTGNTNYTYGELGGAFYHSDELMDIFPKN